MPIAAQLSDLEKQDVLRHLGYPTVSLIPSTGLGFPALGQPMFLVALSTNILEPDQVGRVRQYLTQLDSLNIQIMNATQRLQARKVGEIELNPDELDQLDREAFRWANILADLLGGYLNRYSARWSKYFQGMNRSVIHS